MCNICTEFSNNIYSAGANVYYYQQYLVMLVIYGELFYTNDVKKYATYAYVKKHVKVKRNHMPNNNEQNSSGINTGSRKY